MSIKGPECKRRIMDLLIGDAERKPVKVRPAPGMARDRTDRPFYFAWLPVELSDRILHVDNFISIPGNFTMPRETTYDERRKVFRFIDDLLAMRLVNRSWAYRYKPRACVQSVRWMMHAKPYTVDKEWIFAMHCTASMLVRVAPTVEAAGIVAFEHLKTAIVARMMKEMPRKDVQPTVDEVYDRAPKLVPRF